MLIHTMSYIIIMLMARPCTLYFSNLRKFIDEAKDYLSATFVQNGYELLQNVCYVVDIHYYVLNYV